jgi:hypothetical protein
MAVERRGWRPDPYGVHEQRYFSLDGEPTRLVSDGGKTSSDPPPMDGASDVRVQPHGGGAAATPGSDAKVGPNPVGLSGWASAGSVGFAPVEPVARRTLPTQIVRPTAGEVVHHAAPGWYPDPTNHSDLRYWDGAGWTEHTRMATPPDEPTPSPPASRSRITTRTSSALVNIGLMLVAAALIFALIVTGNPRLPSDPNSAAQGNPTQTTSTTLPVHGTDPPTPAAGDVAAWTSQYEDNMRVLGTDEESIDVADDELKGSSGGEAAHNYSTALSAAQQLTSDVAEDQKVPPIPDPAAESDWSTELSDLAVAAAAYFQGFTDGANAKTAAGTNLIQQGEKQVTQAEIRGDDLVSRLSAIES